VPLLINDDVMLAKKIGAEGVHVGQSDMAASQAREILGPDAIIGVTARTIGQAQAAEKAGADYLGSGAVFGTSTKKDAKPMDPAYFQQICESVSIPVVAIGGITADNIRQLKGRKMTGFTIVSGIFAADDIEAQTKKLWKTAQDLCLPGQPERLRGRIEKCRPVVQCITNIVTVNDCANALLAIGGSPTMAHHPEEMADFAAVSDALVCNMGATESLDAMMTAGLASSDRDAEKADNIGKIPETGRAGKAGRPIVIDPVGCASSSFRRGKCLELIKAVQPSCIRGNAAEIRALATDHDTSRGVDDLEAETPDAARSAMDLARKTGAIVIASGETDYVADRTRLYEVKGGTAWMSRVTGTGCMLSSLLGAFLAVENSALSAAACCAMMNACAEKALAETVRRRGGTGTFHICLMDALSGSID
jgi:hydroxyethylthiazole kinase